MTPPLPPRSVVSTLPLPCLAFLFFLKYFFANSNNYYYCNVYRARTHTGYAIMKILIIKHASLIRTRVRSASSLRLAAPWSMWPRMLVPRAPPCPFVSVIRLKRGVPRRRSRPGAFIRFVFFFFIICVLFRFFFSFFFHFFFRFFSIAGAPPECTFRFRYWDATRNVWLTRVSDRSL